MQSLLYGEYWNETFDCCSHYWIKFGSCQVKKCPTSPANVKAKINEGEEAKKSKAAINEKDMMFMEFLNLVLKLQLL